MKFKEFSKWCNERVFDGCWGLTEAALCCTAVSNVIKQPFWKREKIWQKDYASDIVPIVEKTNELIAKANAN